MPDNVIIRKEETSVSVKEVHIPKEETSVHKKENLPKEETFVSEQEAVTEEQHRVEENTINVADEELDDIQEI
jgi:hypothetical protein